MPLFVLDPRLLRSPPMSRARLAYLADALTDLDAALRARGSRLVIRSGDPRAVVPAVAREMGAAVVALRRLERLLNLPWLGEGPELDAWRAGKTGYPVVDAALRQLAAEA